MTKEERREYMKAYRESHREQIRESQKRCRAKHFLESLNLDDESLQAYLLWIKNRIEAPEYVPVRGMTQKNGLPVVAFYCADEPNGYYYSVQYAGSGHYFKTEEEMNQYIRSRGWEWRCE